jgi:hypothetical protein
MGKTARSGKFNRFTEFSTDFAEYLLTGLWNMVGAPSLSCR